MEFKDLIKNRRIEIGATLEDIAKIVGVSKATVQRWESGNIANIRRDKIVKLAKALNVSPAYLMGWEEEPDIPNHPDILPIETKKSPLSAQWRVVNRFMRKKILKLMSLLARKSKLMRPSGQKETA